MTKIRVGVKVKGKWSYRHYVDFKCRSVPLASDWNDLNLWECIQNACYWAYYKGTGDAKPAQSPVCLVDAFTVQFVQGDDKR